MTVHAKTGIRNDRMRKIVQAARKQGWDLVVDGRGHVRATNPQTGAWFIVSGTSNGAVMGHHYMNTRAAARRAGLDVTNL